MQKRAKKTAKVGDEVMILSVPWHEDDIYVGTVKKLKTLENRREFATVDGGDNIMIVIESFVFATELMKVLV